MKKSMVLGIALVLGTMAYLPAGLAGQVQSLRGVVPIESDSQQPTIKHKMPDREPISRNYVEQPPLIPHDISGYQIDLKFNKCLSCHSWANYKEARATKISATHFKDRDGNDLANIAARRYFCTQCHVPQLDAKPLVENDFKPVEALSGK